MSSNTFSSSNPRESYARSLDSNAKIKVKPIRPARLGRARARIESAELCARRAQGLISYVSTSAAAYRTNSKWLKNRQCHKSKRFSWTLAWQHCDEPQFVSTLPLYCAQSCAWNIVSVHTIGTERKYDTEWASLSAHKCHTIYLKLRRNVAI